MSRFIIFIYYHSHNYELEVNENDSLRSVMTRAFDKIGITDKYYTHDKYIFKNGDKDLNSDPNTLNHTLKEEEIVEDDKLELIETAAIDEGRLNRNYTQIISKYYL